MEQDKKENYQDLFDDGDFAIADDAQIADMQREYAALGINSGKNESRLCTYPLPVYMTDGCFDFCKKSKEMIVIISNLDKLFVSRNQKSIDFLKKSIGKNATTVSVKGGVTQDIFLPMQRMPIKQSMYRLLELHNAMSIMLDDLSTYDKSMSMQEVITRHLLVGSILHGICI